MILNKIHNIVKKHGLVIVMIYAILARIIIALFFQAITIFPDSGDYIVLGDLLSQFNLENYPGNRTPGYPMLITIANNNLSVTIFFQLIIGLLSTYLIYDFTKQNTNKINAFWVTFTVTSFIHFLFFEFAILTESLTLFLIILSFWIIKKYHLFSISAPKQFYFLLSLIFSWLYITRPMFIYFSVGFSLFYLVKHFKLSIKVTLTKCLLILLLPLLSYFSWNNFNKKNIGYFTNTPYFGINLSQVATTFFDKAPDDTKVIRDIFVRKRDSLSQHLPGALPMTVWFAHEELLQKTNLNEQELSFELGRISKKLFKAHPELYAKQVAESVCLFFGHTDSLKWSYSKFKNKYFAGVLARIWLHCQRYILVFFNILFIAFSLRVLFIFLKSKCKLFNMDLFIVCIVFSGALSQALVAFGSNSRFAFPFFPLIVYFVIVNIFSLKNTLLSQKMQQ